MVSCVAQVPEFDSTTWLNWLVSVAVRADELVAIPINREYFWRMLRDWDAEHDHRGPRSPVTRGYVPYNAVAILPRRRLSVSHKFAVVAAIHDAICDKTKRIDPWGAHKRLRSAGLVRAKAGIAYAVLCSEVRNLTEDDRERIEKVLSDVEADLASRFADPTPTVPESTNSGGNGIELPRADSAVKKRDSQAVVAKLGKDAKPDTIILEATLPVQPTVSLFNDLEQNILEALGSGRMTGQLLADAAGYKYNSTFKQALSAMVRHGILVNRSDSNGRGYERTGK